MADVGAVGSETWEPAFWTARYLTTSPWIEHIPFAFWLVSSVRPRLIVEVGTRLGVSYLAFCQAIDELALEARCCAIDLSVVAPKPGSTCAADMINATAYNDAHYSSFSSLIKSASAEAALKFRAGSIDLLHLHMDPKSDQVRQELDTWLPKMSPDGIVLIAGTTSIDGEFGVRAAFNDLRSAYATFEFIHGGGLGILAVGKQVPAALRGLLPSADDGLTSRWRKSFSRLGRAQLDRHLLETDRKRRPGRRAAGGINGSAQSHSDETAKLENEQLQSALADEKRRVRTLIRENQQIKISLRNAQRKAEDPKVTEKHLNALRNELAEKAEAMSRMGTRIAALKDEIRRSDRYVAQLLTHYDKQRTRVESRLGSLVSQIHTDTDLEAVRSTVRRFERAAMLGALNSGVLASPKRGLSGLSKAVYLHYRFKQMRKDAAALTTIASSGLFDSKYYLSRYDDVAKAKIDPLLHFVDFGVTELRDPSPYFDTSFYLETYPDVAKDGVNPLLHFVTRGREEGRIAKRTPSIKAILGDWTPPAAPEGRVSRDTLKPLPNRVVIYTAIAGGYEDLKPPAFRPKNCDFVAFTDQPVEVEGWQVRPLNFLHPDPTRAARFAKLHPHLYFPDYEHSIWIDGNIGIHGDIREFFRRLRDDQFLGIFVHPLRDCIYVEGEECIKRKKDKPEVINRQVAHYRQMGFPEHAGLWETNVLVRRHNDRRCVELMLNWWREMEVGSRRDQISLPVVVERLSVDIAGLGPPQVDARNHPMLSLVKHPPRREVDIDIVPPARISRPDVDAIPMDVGVCVYNSPNETRACLESLVAARRPQDTIIVVDDCSAEPTAALLDEFARQHENVKLVRHEVNRGYTASANSVLKNSTAPWVVLINSDAVVGRRSLAKMIACGEQFPQIGVVGALSNAASWQSVPYLTGPDGKWLVNTIPSDLTIDDMDRICDDLSSGVVPFVPLVNGFCYAIRRTLIETIGYFDEEGFPQGYGEEDDFCLRAGAAGFLCAIATDSYVFHVKSATFTSDRRKPLVEAGVQTLRRKHTPERLKAALEIQRGHPELRRLRERIAERLRDLSVPLVPAQMES